MGKPGFPISQPLLGAAGTPHREGEGETRFPHMFTSGLMRGAHNARMKILYCSWEGVALPNPPGGEGLPPPQAGVRFDRLTAGGETWFPHIFTSELREW